MLKNIALLFILSYFFENAQALNGCTDPLANNYNAAATVNDGSCTYNGATINIKTTKNLPAVLDETSGLIWWNNAIWTHNDDTDTSLYAVDTATAALKGTYPLPRVTNQDWEEISQDDNYVYVGDFGNNANGNRTNLHILRIEKNSLLAHAPVIDTIWFSYSNQTDFTGTGGNNTDFDCEAFIVSADSIYLFTKQWVSEKTSFYSLPKTPGTYIANLRGTINISGLATGATYLENKRLVVLIGYTSGGQPFMYLLYDFSGHDFSSGNKRKINLNLLAHQTEGIATQNGLKYYVSNEAVKAINLPQQLHTFDLSNFLKNYLSSTTTGIFNNKKKDAINVFPNPASDIINIKISQNLIDLTCTITNLLGKEVLSVKLSGENTPLNIQSLPAGAYVLHVGEQSISIIKQ